MDGQQGADIPNEPGLQILDGQIDFHVLNKFC